MLSANGMVMFGAVNEHVCGDYWYLIDLIRVVDVEAVKSVGNNCSMGNNIPVGKVVHESELHTLIDIGEPVSKGHADEVMEYIAKPDLDNNTLS